MTPCAGSGCARLWIEASAFRAGPMAQAIFVIRPAGHAAALFAIFIGCSPPPQSRS
jgi:hypothetical protein